MSVRVDAPPSGKWAGHNFIRRHQGGGVSTAEARAILALLTAPGGYFGAATAYGVEHGTCWCGKQLVTTKDRAVGIHPDCFAKI